MSRLIDPVPRGGKLFAAGDTTGQKAQTYLERVAKYVPAEIIAAYLSLLPVVLAGTSADTTRRTVWLAVIFAIGAIFTPLYLWRFPGDLKVKWYHLVISTAAFVVWTYSIRGGLFDDVGIYDTVGAAVSLAVFTLASGLFAPTAS
jgi:hypothetical protein